MWSGEFGGGKLTSNAGTVMKDCVIAFPINVNLEYHDVRLVALPARIKENVMHVPATPFTMRLSDIAAVFDYW